MKTDDDRDNDDKNTIDNDNCAYDDDNDVHNNTASSHIQ